MQYPILIAGGGITGLRIGSLLADKDIPFKLLETRDRLGGRILTHTDTRGNAFDLGPTWYWPEAEPTIVNLIEELKLPVIEQYNTGKSLFESSSKTPPKEICSAEVNRKCMRLDGGVNTLINAIKQNIPESSIELNTKVTSVTRNADHSVVVHAFDKKNHTEKTYQCSQIILTLPPRLLLENVTFTPELPENMHMDLLNKPTWMGAQAKIVVTYHTPFWREKDLSGNAISWAGPLREIYDASTENGDSALFGFFSLPPALRENYSAEDIQTLVIDQLTRLFGERSKEYKNILYKDWSQDEEMTTAGDKLNIESFPAYGQPPAFFDNIHFAGTEFDDKNGGHLEGALRSAEAVFNKIVRKF